MTRRSVIAGGCIAAATVLGGCGGRRAADPGQETLGSTSDVPVGGGTVFVDQEVVVTQPTAGVFRAFSAICTHQGCTVNEVVDGTINCPCHGSKYSVGDGSVVTGPAQKPLPKRRVTVDGVSLKLV